MTKALLLVLLFCSSGLLCGITRIVNIDGSGQYTSIQVAINISADNDTVLVYPGRYLENISILNKRIILCSRELTTGNPLYIGQTVIDGQRLGSCIVVSGNGQNPSLFSIIRGFTMTNGQAGMGESIWYPAGGGIQVGYNANVVITNNRIIDNRAGLGGGIYISSGSMNLQGNSINKNIASVMGGGVYLGRNTIINFDSSNRCNIYNNFCGQGSDILFNNFDNTPTVYADTISVFSPTTYFIRNEQGLDEVSPQPVIVANHAFINEINHDLYVSPIGNDDNDGLSASNPLKTIAVALQRIAPDSLNLKTINLAPGEYRQSEGQIYPIQLKAYVNLNGSSQEDTKLILDDAVFPTIGIVGKVIQDIQINNFTLNGSNIQGNSGIFLTPENLTARILIERITIEYLNSLHIYSYEGSCGIFRCQNMIIRNSTFRYNRSNGSAGIRLGKSSGLIEDCNFIDNIADDLTHDMAYGGDVEAWVKGNLQIRNCIFSGGQTTFNNPEALHGMVSIYSVPGSNSVINIENCLFSDSHAMGGAAYTLSCESPGEMNITNCTFANNTSLDTAAVLNGYVNVKNCIFNNPTFKEIMLSYPGAYGVSTHLNIDYSNVRGGADLIPEPPQYFTWGVGNTSSAPLFASINPLDDNYLYLATGSPCIDTGTPDTTGLSLPIMDLAGNYRIWNNRIDMGCYEFGSEPVGNEDEYEPEGSATVGGTRMYNYPNPFNPTTTICFNIPKSSNVNLAVYNIRGQIVRQLADENMPLGQHKVVWDGKDGGGKACGSGVYFYRLSTSEISVTKKMLLLK
jgi:hypothetical protein